MQYIKLVCPAKIAPRQTEIVYRIQDIGFPHSIISHKGIDAGMKLQIQVFQIAKIGYMDFIQLQRIFYASYKTMLSAIPKWLK